MNRSAFLFVAPGEIGGAVDHSLATLRLLLDRGLRVSVVAWPGLPQGRRQSFADVGCPFYEEVAGPLAGVPGLAGAIAIGMCDIEFVKRSSELTELGCARVWLNLMTWLLPQEWQSYERTSLFDAYVFQSEYQRGVLERALRPFGYDGARGHLIRGAFTLANWPYCPAQRDPDGEFVVGKLARPDYAKWPQRLWALYQSIDCPWIRAVVMGVDDKVLKWIGSPPPWAEVLPPRAIPAVNFYQRIHCLMPPNYGFLENWPRIGLEAMACGVPIVAPREGGWCNMIEHGVNGFLAGSKEEFARYGSMLARDEDLRMRIVSQARHKLETELANPDVIWAGWKRLFSSLGMEI